MKTAAALNLSKEASLKPRAQFKYIGSEFPRTDAALKSTGTAIYGIDVDIPGMHHAVVRRCPVAGGRLASVDRSVAEAMSGVTDIVTLEAGVAVVARSYWQAKKANALSLGLSFSSRPVACKGCHRTV